MSLNTLTYLAIMIFSGMAMGRLVKQIHLPNVTGYLLAGLLIGPVSQLLLGEYAILPADVVTQMSVISDVALGFIAFSIGGEFKISFFKRVGVTPIVIAVLESLLAVVFVALGLLAIGKGLSFALALGSIAAATAPAATIMVIKQYRAKGPVTETLLSVVALDDATALIFFSIAVAIAQALSGAGVSLGQAILSPLWEIGGALLVGFVLGILFIVPLRWFKKDGNRMALLVAFVFLAVGLADLIHVSQLLTCMAMGAAFCNFSGEVKGILRLSDAITPPIFLLFFVLSGADLQITVLPTIGLVGVVYIVVRVLGKMAGSWLGATLCHADANIRRWLGPALMPQAGVAIGLSLAVTRSLPEVGGQIRAVVLCGTIIYELLGPAVAKFSLKKAGEIQEG